MKKGKYTLEYDRIDEKSVEITDMYFMEEIRDLIIKHSKKFIQLEDGSLYKRFSNKQNNRINIRVIRENMKSYLLVWQASGFLSESVIVDLAQNIKKYIKGQ